MLTAKPRFPIREILIFGFLPSFLKIWIYRWRGYCVGRKVRIGFGSVICARKVVIGDRVSIGFLTIVRGQSIRLGSHVTVGSLCFMDTPHIDIGEETKINEQVFIGGLQFPDSKLIVGRNCQIMQMTFINPTRSIIIGDDTGIGGDCLIFGHSSWLSRFEGYPVDFEPIRIGNSVSLAWRVFVLPGVDIGDGAVIGANSLVNRTIPPRCLAVGFPARVVAKSPQFPSLVSLEQKKVIFKEIVEGLCAFLEGSEIPCEWTQEHLITVHQRVGRHWFSKNRIWNLWVAVNPMVRQKLNELPQGLDAVLSLQRLPDDLRAEWNRARIVWIDIEAKERADFENDLADEVIQFFRRYGVRFDRIKPK